MIDLCAVKCNSENTYRPLILLPYFLEGCIVILLNYIKRHNYQRSDFTFKTYDHMIKNCTAGKIFVGPLLPVPLIYYMHK